MGKVSIAGREFEIDVVSRGEQVTFRLVVEYETERGDRFVERSTLAVESRSELTTDAVSAALTEWADERGVAFAQGGRSVVDATVELVKHPVDRARALADRQVSAGVRQKPDRRGGLFHEIPLSAVD